LMEAGVPAVGISGFYGFGLPDNGPLVPELAAVLARLQPQRILFCGDADTATNILFAHAAMRRANLVKPLPGLLPCIPINGPGKGADDCREPLGSEFVAWWQERNANAVAVSDYTTPLRLALSLFEAEADAIACPTGTARLDMELRLVKLAAAMKTDPLVQGRVLKFAVEKLGLARRELNRAVTSLEKRMARRQGSVQRWSPAQWQLDGREADGVTALCCACGRAGATDACRRANEALGGCDLIAPDRNCPTACVSLPVCITTITLSGARRNGERQRRIVRGSCSRFAARVVSRIGSK
jgi:hypothetical protein